MRTTARHPQKPARVLLVDDHAIFREGLRSLLDREPNLHVVGEGADGRQATGLVEKLRPDVVIMDVMLPNLNGIEATRQILRDHEHVRIIALTLCGDQQSVREMFAAGASGYVLKQADFSEIVKSVETVMLGRTYVSPQIATLMVSDYRRPAGKDAAVMQGKPAYVTLTPREREVLQLVAEGRATKEIAGALNVSVKTIESHRGQLMRKLNLFSVAELTKYAICEGLTTLGLHGETIQEHRRSALQEKQPLPT